jgi:hypothetical protein
VVADALPARRTKTSSYGKTAEAGDGIIAIHQGSKLFFPDFLQISVFFDNGELFATKIQQYPY